MKYYTDGMEPVEADSVNHAAELLAIKQAQKTYPGYALSSALVSKISTINELISDVIVVVNLFQPPADNKYLDYSFRINRPADYIESIKKEVIKGAKMRVTAADWLDFNGPNIFSWCQDNGFEISEGPSQVFYIWKKG